MSYMIFEKDNCSTPEVFDKKVAQKYIDEGYKVKIDKVGWGLKPTPKKVKKSKKKGK